MTVFWETDCNGNWFATVYKRKTMNRLQRIKYLAECQRMIRAKLACEWGAPILG